MSDIREAFEAIKKLAFDAVGGKDPNSDKALVEIYHACEAALQSQTAPAVPEGLDFDLISAVLEDYANLQTSGVIPCANRYSASDANEQAELLDMLAAAPQPDHSPDGTVTDYGTKSAPAADGGEVAGWQFYQDGKWHNGDDRIKDHRANTEAAGIPVRDVYTHPAKARIAELEKALEPFAELGESYDESFADDDEATFADDELTVGDLRRAAALLKDK